MCLAADMVSERGWWQVTVGLMGRESSRWRERREHAMSARMEHGRLVHVTGIHTPIKKPLDENFIICKKLRLIAFTMLNFDGRAWF